MRRFDRQAAPDFWAAYERRWLFDTASGTVDPLTWQRDKRTLAAHFHERVRPHGEPRRCAYCDGPLGVESPETIDHFIGKTHGRAFTMAWDNLYPACVACNTTYKGEKGSCALVRPDVDPVEEWFDFHEETGRLAPAPELDRRTRARIRLTIRVLGLNASERCTMRKRMLRDLQAAFRLGDNERLADAVRAGPYRFVVKKFLASKKRFGLLL